MNSKFVRFQFRANERGLIFVPALRTWMRSVLLPIVLTGLATAVSAASLDTGDITAEASALLTVFQVIAAIAAVVAIIFAALSIRGRNIGEGIVSLLCAIGAIFVIGHAQSWVTSITGISVQQGRQSMTNRQGSVTPLNDSLNKPKNKLGLDYRVSLSCLTVGVCVALFIHVLFGIALMIALPAVLRFALRKDRQLYRLWCLSFVQSAYYDPGKVRR